MAEQPQTIQIETHSQRTVRVLLADDPKYCVGFDLISLRKGPAGRESIGRDLAFIDKGETVKINYFQGQELPRTLEKVRLAKYLVERGIQPREVAENSVINEYASLGKELLELANRLRRARR